MLKWIGIVFGLLVLVSFCAEDEPSTGATTSTAEVNESEGRRQAEWDMEAKLVLDSASALIRPDVDLWRQLPAAREMLEDLKVERVSEPQVAYRKALLDSVTVFEALQSYREENPVTRPGYVGCLTEELFDQFTTLLAQRDERGMVYLIESNACVMMQEGLAVSVLDQGWTGQVRARLYLPDGGAAEVWTFSEAVDNGR